jgi:predicted TIM-barrel fold metal-dependent hydrolase
VTAQQRLQVPWSGGTEPPKIKVPLNSADCHPHIYDSRFPCSPKAVLKPGDATVAEYRALQKRLGTTRNVVVQPSSYGTDNRCLLDALSQFGPTARGIAVVDTTVSDPELKQLNAAGVRGIRFNLQQAGATTLDMLENLSRRITPLGWHIQINASPSQFIRAADLLPSLPCPIIFDHLAHVLNASTSDPGFALISSLLAKGNTWMKLSGAYIDSKVGPPTYADCTAVAKAYVKQAPDRCVWGTDWPHPTTPNKPDDAVLLDLLAVWVPDEQLRHRVLVENPERLYGFPT